MTAQFDEVGSSLGDMGNWAQLGNMMKVFLSMPFSKLDLDREQYCQKEGGRDDFEKLVKNTRMLRDMNKSMASSKMDVSYFTEADLHAEFVEWQDAGCPDGWGPPGHYGEEWPEDPEQLAPFAKGSKGKGKGK